ncbi:MAG TPA: MauE/DoxX family redox-associated membrane protein [Opitutaceae bacterium]|nr:MauE/DoxX family redox-associated membrane protein [Opitutaceae bacterium]
MKAAADHSSAHAGHQHPHQREEGRGKHLSDYLPLIVIFALAILAALAKQRAYADGWSLERGMHDFMGFFLVVFSMFKFFDLSGFADGFQMYDLLAKPFRPYAYVYPFIELGLGLGYLATTGSVTLYAATIVVMGFGALGVGVALSRKLDIECACMGTVLHVPLSTVALVEDIGMAVMAAAMWVSVK